MSHRVYEDQQLNNNTTRQMVRMAVGMAQHIRGLVHVQTNPYYSYSTEKTVVNALRGYHRILVAHLY